METKLDKKSMTYGGIIIAVIISVIVGGTLIFEDSEGTIYHLSSDGAIATHECFEPAMKSDCINGIKAEGTRCYYDLDAGRRYKKCSDSWQVIPNPITKDSMISVNKPPVLKI